LGSHSEGIVYSVLKELQIIKFSPEQYFKEPSISLFIYRDQEQVLMPEPSHHTF